MTVFINVRDTLLPVSVTGDFERACKDIISGLIKNGRWTLKNYGAELL